MTNSSTSSIGSKSCANLSARSRRATLIAVMKILIGTLAAFWNSFDGNYAGDDSATIVRNTTIRQLWPISHVLFSARQNTAEGRPLLNLSLAINYAMGGLDPFGYHVFNFAVHAFNALLLFGLARRTLELKIIAPRYRRHSASIAWAIALLWAVHPIQTESVTYIVQRVEAMASFFYLATLYALARGAESQVRARRAASAVWFALGIVSCWLGTLTKEIIVSAPLMALLYDRVFLARSWREVWRSRGGVHLGLFASWGLLAQMLTSGSHTKGFGVGVTPMQYFLTQWVALVRYLSIAFWPRELFIRGGNSVVLPDFRVALCGLTLVVLVLATVAAWRLTPPLGWLATSFFAILSPSSSFIPIATQAMTVHRMYLALAVVVALAVFAGFEVWSRLAANIWRPLRVAVPCVVVVAIAVALGYRTYLQNEFYRRIPAVRTAFVDRWLG